MMAADVHTESEVPAKLCGSCGGVPCRFAHPPAIKHKIPWEKPVVTVPTVECDR